MLRFEHFDPKSRWASHGGRLATYRVHGQDVSETWRKTLEDQGFIVQRTRAYDIHLISTYQDQDNIQPSLRKLKSYLPPRLLLVRGAASLAVGFCSLPGDLKKLVMAGCYSISAHHSGPHSQTNIDGEGQNETKKATCLFILI